MSENYPSQSVRAVGLIDRKRSHAIPEQVLVESVIRLACPDDNLTVGGTTRSSGVLARRRAQGESSQSRATRPKLIRKVQKLSPKPRLSEGVHRSEKHVCGCLCDQAGFYDYFVLCGSCKSSQGVQKCLKSYLLPIGRIEE